MTVKAALVLHNLLRWEAILKEATSAMTSPDQSSPGGALRSLHNTGTHNEGSHASEGDLD